MIPLQGATDANKFLVVRSLMLQDSPEGLDLGPPRNHPHNPNLQPHEHPTGDRRARTGATNGPRRTEFQTQNKPK